MNKASLLILFVLIAFMSCGCHSSSVIEHESSNSGEKARHYAYEEIQAILNTSDYVSSPDISELNLDKYEHKEFIFDNHCFVITRDMDFNAMFLRPNSLQNIVQEYPPQVVRTIENNGRKSLYFVYETDENTRLYIFFYDTDEYSASRGYPLVMKKSLEMKQFSVLKKGDSIDKVEQIDPIATLVREGLDLYSDEAIHNIYETKGMYGKYETMSSVHLCTDGIVKIDYKRASLGKYYITNIQRSSTFTIDVLGGRLCYKIYPEDYMN